MFLFSDASIPKHLAEKISIPYEIATSATIQPNSIVVDCKSPWGDIHHQRTQQLIHYYSRIYPNNKVFLFLVTDDCESFMVPKNIHVYRTSLLKSAKSPNEYLLPYIWEGLSEPFAPLKRTMKPRVGFCGLVSPYRIKTLQLFEQDVHFDTHYILRNTFWGGKPNDPQVVRDYQENMRNTHFNICNRGKGNFAIRFYQTLSAGRIPIVLNTDLVLPLEQHIDWNQIIVLADTEEELVEKTLLFWKTRNIEDAQRRTREIYETYFEGTKFLDQLFAKEGRTRE